MSKGMVLISDLTRLEIQVISMSDFDRKEMIPRILENIGFTTKRHRETDGEKERERNMIRKS